MRRLLLLCLLFLLQHGVLMYERRVSRSPCYQSWLWDDEGGDCYYLGHAGLSWFQATQHCGHINGGLADMSNKRTQTFIKSFSFPKPRKDLEGYWLDRDQGDKSENCPYLVVASRSKKEDSCLTQSMGFMCITKAMDNCPRIQCEHICLVKGPNAAQCLCQVGYDMDVHGQCIDIDECNDTNRCDHRCVNTPGDYNCSCEPGYTLEGDDTCIAQAGMWNFHDHNTAGNTMLTAVFVSVPIACIVIFVSLTMWLKRLNRRAQETLRVHEEEKERDLFNNYDIEYDDPWLMIDQGNGPVEAWRVETAV